MSTKNEMAASGKRLSGLLEQAAGEFRWIGYRVREEVEQIDTTNLSDVELFNLERIAGHCDALAVFFGSQVRSPDVEIVRHLSPLASAVISVCLTATVGVFGGVTEAFGQDVHDRLVGASETVEQIQGCFDVNVNEEEDDSVFRLRSGVEEWNEWRRTNLNVTPRLSGADLSGVDLTSANLRETKLRETNLRKANLRYANLFGADLFGADLFGAYLVETHLSGANLTRANLREANLVEAKMFEADLTSADLRKADLRKANLRKADLSGANLFGADLFDAKLRGATWDESTIWPKGFKPPKR